MVDPKTEQLEEHLALLAARADDAVAAGERRTSVTTMIAPLDFQPRIDRALECADLLRQFWVADAPTDKVLFVAPDGDQLLTSPLPWQKLGRFEIRRELGRGGFGVVYLAYDPRLDREIALKVPRVDFISEPSMRARFQHEARAAAGLDHPNIVQVYETGEVGPVCYIASAYCPGLSLAAWLRERTEPVSAADAAALIATLADAIQHAHERGLLHRDLKPANILLQLADSPAGKPPSDPLHLAVPKIADFGLAKYFVAVAGAAANAQTQNGAIVGTPQYMAPEQADSGSTSVGPPTDVYALGAMLYELLTARPPFQADSVLDMLMQVKTADPVAPSRLRPRLSRDLETICLKCLEKDPPRRYPSAAALAGDLRRYLAGKPIHARPAGVPDRCIKWAGRHPAVSALLVAVTLITTVGMVSVTWAWRRAESALDKEEIALKKESQERKLAVANVYFQSIALAQRDWQSAKVANARQILQGCPEDLRNWEWHYLERLCNPQALTLSGHSSDPSSLVWSPDGTRLASAVGVWEGTSPGEVRVWDGETGKELAVCRGHTQAVRSVAFSPDGSRLASGGWDNTVRVFDAASGAPLRVLSEHKGPVHAVAYSPDGRYLASGSGDDSVILWDAATGAKLFVYPCQTAVHCLAFSPDSQLLVAGTWAGTLNALQLADRRERFSIPGFGDIRALAFRPDGRRLVIGGYARVIRVFDIDQRRQVLTYTSHLNPVLALSFNPDGQYVASADSAGDVKIWDAGSGRTVQTVRRSTGRVGSLAFHPDGRRLAVGSEDRVVTVADLTSDVENRTLGPYLNQSSVLAFHPDGKQLYAAFGHTRDARARFIQHWNLDNPGPPRVIAEQPVDYASVAVRPDGKALALGSKDGSLKLWDPATDREIRRFPARRESVTALAFHPDGQWLASGGQDKVVRIHDTESGAELFSFAGHTDEIACLSFHKGGKYLASASKDGTARIWRLGTPESCIVLPSSEFALKAVAFSPDGSLIASAGDDTIIRLWDFATLLESGATAAPRLMLRGHVRTVTGLAFMPDSCRLASSSLDRSIKIWDTANGREALALQDATALTGVAVSPDGRRLVSVSKILCLWDAGDSGPKVDKAATDWQADAWHQDQAENAEENRQWFAARFHFGRLLERQPTQITFLTRHGSACCELGKWEEASADFARRATLEPAVPHVWYRHAIARLGAGDEAGYRRILTEMHGLYAATTDPAVASVVLYASFPLPDTFTDPTTLLRLGKLGANAFRGNARVYGAAFYRAGKYAEAIQLFREAAAAGWAYRAWDYLFLAMAHHRLGHTSEAKDWLAKAISWLKLDDEQEAAGGAGLFYNWIERVEVDRLHREAEALLAAK